MTWQDWARRHATIFSLTEAQDGAMLAEWVRLFVAEGFTPEELADATVWMATHGAPTFRNQHLPRLEERVRGERLRKRTQAEAQARQDWQHQVSAPCEVCGGTGVVAGLTVAKRHGRRKWRGCVSCRCEAGKRYYLLRSEAGYPILSLDEYERENPNWRTQKPEREVTRAVVNGLGGSMDALIQRAMTKRKQHQEKT